MTNDRRLRGIGLASDGVRDYEYDAERNRTKRTSVATGAGTEYTADCRHRPTKVTQCIRPSRTAK